MADIIATEAQAASIGGGSSYTANLMVTRVRAVALGCSISGSYSNNQLVCLKDLYKASSCSCQYNCNCNSVCTCNSTCDCTGGYCSCNTTCSCTSTCSCTGNCSCNKYTETRYSCGSEFCQGNTCSSTGSYINNCKSNYDTCAQNSSWPCEYQSCGSYYGNGLSCDDSSSNCTPYYSGYCKCNLNTTCYGKTIGCSCDHDCTCVSACTCETECTGNCSNCYPNACVGDGTGSSWGCTCQYVG